VALDALHRALEGEQLDTGRVATAIQRVNALRARADAFGR
jgi:hypothetical protein